MRAWMLDGPGGIESAQLREVPDPSPGRGEALLEVRYAALNPADFHLAAGMYPAQPTWPHIVGRDALGTVVAVGDDVRNIRVGESAMLLRCDVGITRWGSFAQRVVVPADALVLPPTGWTDEEAGSGTLVYLTAWRALHLWENHQYSNVLVSGASGGVGVAVIQLGKGLGHRVIGLSRSADKSKQLMDLGATLMLDPQQQDWTKKLKQFLAPRKIDLVIDTVGGPLFTQLLSTLGMDGRVSIVGLAAGPVPEFNTGLLLAREIKIGGLLAGTTSIDGHRRAWEELTSLLAATSARPQIDSIFPFEQLQNAFKRLREGPLGKVLIRL